jgi:hypothetical protein
VSYARPALGPNEQNIIETLVRILRETGLPASTLRRIVGALLHFVRGTAQTVADSRLAAAATGVSDQAWWSARSAALHKVAPDFAVRLPQSAWLAEPERDEGEGEGEGEGDSASYLEGRATEMFATGLTILLDGIEVAMTRR